jgi:F-type H+-transporting ATPase subunit delta
MIAQQVAKKYARALMLSVKDKGLVDLAAEQFVGLRPIIAGDPELRSFLSAPQIATETKEEVVRTVFGGRLDVLLLQFLMVLIEKHRVNYLLEIIDEFDRLVKAEKGILKATVITAVPMSEQEEEQVITQLTAKTGMKIELEPKVDRSIIGGMIVMMHNQIIDGSIKHYLKTIEEQLAGVKVH